MIAKLAFKNVKKSFKDFMIYFVTLLLAVSIFYMFNSIYAQKSVIILTSVQDGIFETVKMMMNYMSVFVAVVLGFLIIYANGYFIKRRHKEFGVYLMLGMKQKEVSLILLLETLMIGMVALACGLLIGILGSQFMSILTAKIFEADLRMLSFIFDPQALLKTILYFGIIFIVVAIFNLLVLSKVSVIQLLQANRQNQKQKIPKFGLSVVLFIVSLIILAISYHLVLENGLLNMSKELGYSVLLGSIGTVIFFFSVAGGLTQILQKNKKMYYKNLNMFVFRQLSSKINSNFISISVVCITLLLTIGIFSLGYSLETSMSRSLKESVPYSLEVFFQDEASLEKIESNLKASMLLDQPDQQLHKAVFYKTALNESDLLTQEAPKNTVYINVMGLTNYNALRQGQGEKAVVLKQGEYKIVESSDDAKRLGQLLQDHQAEVLAGVVPSEEMDHFFVSNEERGLILVVDDAQLTQLEKSFFVLAIQDINQTTEQAINNRLKTMTSDDTRFSWMTKTDIYQSSITSKSLIAFIAIYLGLVFMLASSAILSIQQLSEASDNQSRYVLLQKLGATPRQINRALFSQILIYFAMPMLLAIVHSVIGLKAASEVLFFYGEASAAQSLVIVGLAIFLVYALYFFITYLSSQRVIRESIAE